MVDDPEAPEGPTGSRISVRRGGDLPGSLLPLAAGALTVIV